MGSNPSYLLKSFLLYLGMLCIILPWKLSQGEPGRRLKPSEEMFNRPDLASSAVDIQVLFLPGFWHANSQSWRLLDTVSDVKKQETSPNLTQMESLHSPCWQT